MSSLAPAPLRSGMPTSESTTMAASIATANLAASSTASISAAMENAWAAPVSRTYFVGGCRVQHVRDSHGHSTWTCDCAEFARGERAGSDVGCQHTQRIAAAAELDKLLRTPGLIMPTKCY